MCVPQAKNVLDNFGDVCRVAVPMFLYFMIMWTATLIVTRKFHGTYEQCVTQVGSTQQRQSAWCVQLRCASSHHVKCPATYVGLV